MAQTNRRSHFLNILSNHATTATATTMDSAMRSFEEARFYGLPLEPPMLKPPQEHSNHATTMDSVSDMATLSFGKARFYRSATTTMNSHMATPSFEEARFYGLPLEPLKPPQEHSNHATTTTTTAATTMDSDVATPSFEEARFYFYGLSLEQLTLDPPHELSNPHENKCITITAMDSHIATPSFEEARFYFYGLSLESLTLNPPQEHSNPDEKKCMCSSHSNHPSVPSPRYTSNNMVLLKTAMKNSLLKMGGEKAKFAKNKFIIKRMPQQSLRPRRKAFQIRPCRLGPSVSVPPQCRVQ